jgi:hypothetical protein
MNNRIALYLAIVVMSASASSKMLWAAPNLLTYQGRLQEEGIAVTGNRFMNINICDAATEGACLATGTQSVSVSSGLYRTVFSLPSDADASNAPPLWLEVQVGNSAGSLTTLSPRERLTSSLFALAASSANFAHTARHADVAYLADSASNSNVAASANGLNVLSTGSVRIADGTQGLGKVLTSDGVGNAAWLQPPSIPHFQVFNADGQFAVPDGVTRITVEIWGGGGGGGGVGGGGGGGGGGGNSCTECGGDLSTCLQGGTGGIGGTGGQGWGGEGGAYGKDILSVTPGATYYVVVGQGGDGGAGGSPGSGGAGGVGATSCDADSPCALPEVYASSGTSGSNGTVGERGGESRFGPVGGDPLISAGGGRGGYGGEGGHGGNPGGNMWPPLCGGAATPGVKGVDGMDNGTTGVGLGPTVMASITILGAFGRPLYSGAAGGGGGGASGNGGSSAPGGAGGSGYHTAIRGFGGQGGAGAFTEGSLFYGWTGGPGADGQPGGTGLPGAPGRVIVWW